MDQFKLRTYDGVAVTGFLTLPFLFATGLSELAEQNGSAAWIALLAAFAVMLCLFLTASVLAKRYAGKNLMEIARTVLGKPLGALYAVLFGAYFCLFTGVHIRESTEILKIYGLSFTPTYVIIGLILLTAVIMNLLGGRAIVKSAGFFFVILVLGIVFIMLLGSNRYNPDHLVPVLGNGLPDIAKNSLLMTSLFDGVIVLLLFAPAFSDPSGLKKSGVLSLIVTAAASVLLTLCFTMMFSPPIGSKMMSGLIEMGKSSYYNHFFYRFESILLFLLIFSAAIQSSIGLFIVRRSLSHIAPHRSVKTMTVISALPILPAVLLPANISDLMQGYLPLIRQYSVLLIAGFPLLILIVSMLKRGLGYEKD